MPKKIILFITLAVMLNKFMANEYALASDTTPPTTTVIQSPSSPDGLNNWYISPVTFTLQATDLESGVKEIKYRIDNQNWQSVNFQNTQNTLINPSFEDSDTNTTGISGWEASVIDPEVIYSQDLVEFAPGYGTKSAKILTTGGVWHGINNKNLFTPTLPYDNMQASVWVKTFNVTGSVYFKIYSVSYDNLGQPIYTQISQSNGVSGTNDWTKIEHTFNVNHPNAEGVYIDIGIEGPGTVYIDAATLSTSLVNTSTSVIISTDSVNHTFEYYSIDNDNNTESYSCTTPIKNCITFKLDQTPPGNFINSGAVRGQGGSNHELFVFTDVSDTISGLSTNTNKYQYSVDNQTGYGYYTDLIHCNSTWVSGGWVALEDAVTTNGINTAYLKTQKTDFCNSNWKICKSVNFYAEDMAGNSRTKALCINGPWIKIRGKGIVRSNHNIDMVSEAPEANTDSLIEIGSNFIDFFSSSTNWNILQYPNSPQISYQYLYDLTKSKINLGNQLPTSSGIFSYNGNLDLTNQKIPNNYKTSTFDQIIFIDGDLKISADITIKDESTALFVVSGKIEIDEKVENVEVALIADGKIFTAYNLAEGKATKTLNLKGFYITDELVLQRTLQGTNNDTIPSESFTFEPKYMVKLKQFFNNSYVKWTVVQ